MLDHLFQVWRYRALVAILVLSQLLSVYHQHNQQLQALGRSARLSQLLQAEQSAAAELER